MGKPLRVLIVEDSEDDVLLLLRELQRGGFDVEFERVETAVAMQAALTQKTWDLILSDYTLPEFNAPQALEVMKASGLDLPFIISSGTIGEETAVAALKAGANDFLVKGKFARLGPAIERELREAETRRQRRQAEAALAESEQKYRTLVESAEDTILLTDLTGKHLFANSAYYTSLGYGVGEVPNQAGFGNAHPYDLPELKARMPELLKRGSLITEYRVQHRSGRWLYRSAKSTVIRDRAGQPNSILAIISDITERRRTEERLLASEVRYRRLFEAAKDGILILDASTGKIVDVNPFLIELLGYDHTEFLGKQLWEIGLFKDIVANKEAFLKLQEEGYIRYENLPLETKTGRRIWVEFVSNAYAVGDRQVMQCNIRDITDRKKTQETIQRQLRHLNGLRMIDTAISSSFDIHVTLDIILQQVLAQLGVDAAAILVLNPQMQTIEYAASRGFSSNFLQHTQLKLSEGHAGRAVHERKTIYIPDLLEAGGKLAEVMQAANENFVDYYGTPLVSKDGIKGVLEIYHRSSLNPDPEWLDFLETLAGEAAIAIDNAQLFENLQRANAELEQRVAQRTAELNQTNLELEHANRAKDEFLATMSHELRTPLNSILGLSETLLEQMRDPLSPHQQRSLQIIASSGQHLLELINDILDLSKIEAGKLDHYPQIIGVDDLCRSSLAFVKEQAIRKSITMIYQPDTPVSRIYADPRRLKQILVNLLTNAVKFTPDNGEVILQVEADAEQARIRFSVIDSGIGIASEDLKKLFQPFQQVDSRLTREYEGTGLGLALVQKLADLHGGSVDVESEVGKGSRFTINLPWREDIVEQQASLEADGKPSTDKPADESGRPSEKVLKRGLVLLAEDNKANILTIGDYLETHGYQLVVAHDGLEALARAEEHQPNVILMDIQMPVLDGLEAMRRLRADQRFASTPIIALTALAMPGDRERCLEAGANEYMSKPVSLKRLVEKIQELLGQGK